MTFSPFWHDVHQAVEDSTGYHGSRRSRDRDRFALRILSGCSGTIVDRNDEHARARVGRQGDVIDRNRVRELAEKAPPPDGPLPAQAPSPRQGLIEFLDAIEPDLKLMERVLASMKDASSRPAGQFGRLAAADPTGRFVGLKTMAEGQRALQDRAADALAQARIHERLERVRRRTRGRKSRPEIVGDDERVVSDRLGRALMTLETFVSEAARVGEFV
jgi:hypothetical protein